MQPATTSSSYWSHRARVGVEPLLSVSSEWMRGAVLLPFFGLDRPGQHGETPVSSGLKGLESSRRQRIRKTGRHPNPCHGFQMVLVYILEVQFLTKEDY